MFGTSSSTAIEVTLDLTSDPDSDRFRRLAQLLFTAITGTTDRPPVGEPP